MYKVLSKSALTYLILGLVGVSFLVNWVFFQPDTLKLWWRVLSTLPATFALLTWALGSTSTWRLIWKKFPALNRWIFPDLNGEWETLMVSNFSQMAKYHPDFRKLKKEKINNKIPGKFRISQSWFSINIRFDGDDKYSNSDTVFVFPEKDKETNRYFLTYVYKNNTPDNRPTDEQMYFGSARLEIDDKASFNEMSGHYWTNRNWKRGLNTAGSISAKKMTD